MKLAGEELRCRMAKLAARLTLGERITSATIRRDFGVSKATAKRDIAALRAYLPLRVRRIKTSAPFPANEVAIRATEARTLRTDATAFAVSMTDTKEAA